MSRANYYECHITVDPVFKDKLDILIAQAGNQYFRVADLVMLKEDGSSKVSTKDAFLTGRHEDFNILYERMHELIRCLKWWGFTIRRYKIEKTILDSKYFDICKLIEKKPDA